MEEYLNAAKENVGIWEQYEETEDDKKSYVA